MHPQEIQILLVEDNVDHQLLAELAVTRMKMNIKLVTCSSGEQAINMVASESLRPDLALLDIDLMPGMNGFEVARHLKNLPAMEQTGIVFYTGNENPDHERQALAAGAIGYIVKENDMTQTVAKLKKAIENWQLNALSAKA